MLITLTVDDGQPETMDLFAFFADNEDMSESGEADNIRAALAAGRPYVGGGGASPVFVIERVA